MGEVRWEEDRLLLRASLLLLLALWLWREQQHSALTDLWRLLLQLLPLQPPRPPALADLKTALAVACGCVDTWHSTGRNDPQLHTMDSLQCVSR